MSERTKTKTQIYVVYKKSTLNIKKMIISKGKSGKWGVVVYRV